MTHFLRKGERRFAELSGMHFRTVVTLDNETKRFIKFDALQQFLISRCVIAHRVVEGKGKSS